MPARHASTFCIIFIIFCSQPAEFQYFYFLLSCVHIYTLLTNMGFVATTLLQKHISAQGLRDSVVALTKKMNVISNGIVNLYVLSKIYVKF